MELNPQQSQLRQERSPLVEALGVTLRGKACKCPFHDDKHASGSVYQTEGIWKFTCHTCSYTGDIFDVRSRMEGRSLADILNEYKPEKPKHYPNLEAIVKTYPDVEKVYKYTNPATLQIELAVIRYWIEGRKAFAQCSPNGQGWLKQRPEGKLPLYNRKRLNEAETVIVVEGEKAVHALYDIGIVATTSAGGAGKAKESDWSLLNGKRIYLWPDNDPVDPKTLRQAGILHMKDVQSILETMNCELFWIEPSGLDLPPKGDVVDFLDRNDGETEDKKLAISLVLDEAQPLGAAQELRQRLESIISGEWKSLQWPWPCLTSESQSLLPDTVTGVCGDPGAAKSFFLLEAWWKWHLAGHKTAIFELEDDRVFHLGRVLAQLEQNANLTNAEWVYGNPEAVLASEKNQRDIIDSLGKVLWDTRDGQVTLTDLASWFESRCQEGFEVSIIDPVTAAVASDKPWIDDQRFLFQVKTTAKKYHARLIYAIHPRVSNGKVGASLSRLAGGAAYARFSHSVFWITKHDADRTETLWDVNGNRQVTFDRTLKISKARNGRGAGAEIAFHLRADSLCFDEYGVVCQGQEVKHAQ